MKKTRKKIAALFDEDNCDLVVRVSSQHQCSLPYVITAFVREAMDARDLQYDESDMRGFSKDKALGVDQEGVEIKDFFHQLDDAKRKNGLKG